MTEPVEHMEARWDREARAQDKAIARAQIELAGVSLFDDEGKRRTQSDVLIQLGECLGELFHDSGGDAYITLSDECTQKTFALASVDFKEILHRAYYLLAGRGCNRNSLADAVSTLSAQAKFDGPRHPVYLRVGGDDQAIEIDSGNRAWQAIRITPEEVTLTNPSVRFRRSGKPLELPEIGEPDFSRLWKYLPVTEADRPLVAAFMLAALRPWGPYPVLVLGGVHGAGKSVSARVIKRFIDPSASPLRSPPKESKDLQVAALNSWAPAWDNLSYLSAEFSDDLCRLATGTALAARRLYSDFDEILMELQRPTIINGIEDLATRPDLASRSLVIQCRPPESRRREAEFFGSLEQDAPHIFAGLLHGLQAALRDHQDQPDHGVRMADLAAWASAGEVELGFDRGAFLEAYRRNQENALTAGLDVSPVGREVLKFMDTRSEWKGTPTELLELLEGRAPESTIRAKAWPKAAHVLTQKLVRLSPSLRAAGIRFDHGHDGRSRYLSLCASADEALEAYTPLDAGPEVNAPNASNAGSENAHTNCPKCAGEGCAWCGGGDDG